MLANLKELVLRENLKLPQSGLVKCTWGNASARDKQTGFIVIKPSGVDYDVMRASDMVVVDEFGTIIEGDLRPSSDLPTHLYLYQQFPEIGGIVHTHSTYAVSFAQALRPIISLGTTHADYFHGTIPLTRPLTKTETETSYEHNTGKIISETLAKLQLSASEMPGIIVARHGPFTWGKSIEEAVYHSIVLEEVAKIAYQTITLNRDVGPVEPYIAEKHYERKHGKSAYYGQKG
ncbi:MAG: L-ribulose-5-phosphate 4-epimerase AraD [Culicoidibacterales bacterium]